MECFLGFSDVIEDRTASKLKEEVDNTLDDYQCGETLIVQTYDGASVMSGELSGFQTRVRKDHPYALLFTSVTRVEFSPGSSCFVK